MDTNSETTRLPLAVWESRFPFNAGRLEVVGGRPWWDGGPWDDRDLAAAQALADVVLPGVGGRAGRGRLGDLSRAYSELTLGAPLVWFTMATRRLDGISCFGLASAWG